MNVQHPDMIRQGVPTMHQNLMNQPFFPGPQPQQAQQSPAHNMGPFPNNQGTNPGLGIIGGQPGASNPSYPLGMQPAQAPRRQMFMAQHPAPGSLNTGAGAGPSHMAGLGPGQLQNMSAFPGGGIMGQPSIRRVASQPMNTSGAHMPGMQPGMMGGTMGLNGPPNMGGMRTHMTPQQQQQMQMHLQRQQAQQQAGGGAISPEMGMSMNRAGHLQGAGAMPPHARTASGQGPLMPAGMAQHGMQQQMAHNGFPNTMALQHQHQHQQSQLGTSPHVGGSGQQQPGMPGAMGGNQLLPQAGTNRAQMGADNSMFMNFQNPPIQPPMVHGVPRPPMSNSQFSVNFGASPTPPNPGGDMPQRANPAMSAPGTIATPAQTLEMNAGGDKFPTGTYGMGQPPITAPPRPPSQHSPRNPFPMPQSQPSLPPQHSPRQADRLVGQMPPPTGILPRPQSQPQAIHRQSPIPPAPSRTPRVSHTPLPTNTGGMMPPGRIPPGPGQSPQGPTHQQVQQPASAPPSTQPPQIAPRPPSANAAASARAAHPAPAPPGPSGPQPPAPESSAAAQAAPPAPAPAPAQAPAAPTISRTIYPVGLGQATCRILQLSGSLGVEHKDRLKQSYWESIVGQFFTEKATMKLTLWKDNQQVEAKPFEIGYPILPRFFLVTSQSGVKSMTICVDGARERLVNPSHALVECAQATWTFRYQNGYSIILRGPLTADIIVQPHPIPPQPTPMGAVTSYALKLDRLQFDAFWHDKYVALDAIVGERLAESPRGLPPSPGLPAPQNEDPNRFDEAKYIIEHAIVPTEPINAFGIPQATMRCLELAESVAQMSELIQFSQDTKLGPVDALARFADKLRLARGIPRGYLLPAPPTYTPHVEGSSAFDGHGLNGVNGTPPNMFMHGSGNTAGSSQGSSGGEPSQNASQPDGVDAKQAKGTPQASGSTPASASTPAAAPTPGGPTTPSMANATLKRKAPPTRSGDDSPTTANADQPPAKRAPRKRGRTQGS
ncbi:hypothetical protein BV20DRAFT_662877 [Pilatotrama ljubarskyi]|nr:hypothetical protein BV20DRAFT_662877 [Pilatotrama ljubarskyi]